MIVHVRTVYRRAGNKKIGDRLFSGLACIAVSAATSRGLHALTRNANVRRRIVDSEARSFSLLPKSAQLVCILCHVHTNKIASPLRQRQPSPSPPNARSFTELTNYSNEWHDFPAIRAKKHAQALTDRQRNAGTRHPTAHHRENNSGKRGETVLAASGNIFYLTEMR